MDDDDDERHRREEQERRAKRKASKASKSQSQLEKERKQKEHRQRVLNQHAAGGAAAHAPSSSSAVSKKTAAAAADLNKPVFQELFSQRAQGFQVDFRFRNAPPRPPVGPTFVGPSLDTVLTEQCARYKPHNAVEASYRWKLHTEADVGVPLGPSAMDLRSYDPEHVSGGATSGGISRPAAKRGGTAAQLPRLLHPDDAALLDWEGSWGDTSADRLKREQESKRIKERQILSGRIRQLPQPSAMRGPGQVSSSGRPGQSQQQQPSSSKKLFSRVLNEGMQTWMKKTTYLSNDYTRKVHDFKSLAQTKQELAADLRHKQDEMTQRRSAASISKGFAPLDLSSLKHPTRPNLKPVRAFELLPDMTYWGATVTHVVLDQPPPPGEVTVEKLAKSFVGNVERHQAKARLSCQLFVPSSEHTTEGGKGEPVEAAGAAAGGGDGGKSADRYDAARTYDLDVVPLKDEDAPHASFVLLVDRATNTVTYLPVSSRVQLSRGRPVRGPGGSCRISKRPLSDEELTEREERAAEVNPELAEKHGIPFGSSTSSSFLPRNKRARAASSSSDGANGATRSSTANPGDDKDDDGEDDFGDDDDDSRSSGSADEGMFGTNSKTIVAES